MKAKYICVDNGLNDVIMIFPDLIQHADMFYSGKLVSAGFINPLTMRCYGKSISLNIESRPEDTDIARRQYGGHKSDWPSNWTE